jgi:hypothetical protein
MWGTLLRPFIIVGSCAVQVDWQGFLCGGRFHLRLLRRELPAY